MRKQLKEKELELEILKKAVHIFSKSDGKSINLYTIERMCKVLEISRSSFYRWYTEEPSKRVENKMFMDLITNIFELSKQTYGSPRITEELKRKGYLISKRRVSRLMQKCGLRSWLKKKFKVTTDSNHNYPICYNHLEQNFSVEAPNQVWVSDIPYIKVQSSWLYLTTIIDLYDRL